MSDLTDLDKGTGTSASGLARIRGRLIEYARLMRLDRPIGIWQLHQSRLTRTQQFARTSASS
jgi:hypothetical protein